MSATEWAVMAGFLFGLLAGIFCGAWVTYRALIGTFERHGYDRGRHTSDSDFDEAR